MKMRWPIVAAATTFFSTAIVPTEPRAGAIREAPTPAELVAFLNEMRVGITEEEAAALLAMDGPELVAFLEKQGLAIPERLRRLGPGDSPAEVLTREDVAVIVAPLVAPPGEPKVTGIATDPDAHARMSEALRAKFARRIGLIRLDDDGNTHVPLRNPTDADYAAAKTIGNDVSAAVTIEPLAGLTYDELEDLRAKISGRLQETDLANWGVGLLGRTQTVLVTLPDDAPVETRKELEALAAEAAATASKDAGAQLSLAEAVTFGVGTATETDLRDGAPVGGAKWIRVTPGASYGGTGCTMAYVVTLNNQKRGMSAGHCSSQKLNSGDDVYDMNEDGSSSNNYYGTVIGNWYGQGVDILTWSGEDWEDHTRVYFQNSWKTLVGKTNEADQFVGYDVCGAGWGIWTVDNLEQKCDDIDLVNLDLSYDNPQRVASDLNCFERRVRNGDSGGPTYGLNSSGQALAAGVTHGEYETSIGPWHQYYWCYTTITDALGTANYTLPTGK